MDGLNDCLVFEDLEPEGFLPLATFPPPTTSLLAHVHAMLRALADWHALSLRSDPDAAAVIRDANVGEPPSTVQLMGQLVFNSNPTAPGGYSSATRFSLQNETLRQHVQDGR